MSLKELLGEVFWIFGDGSISMEENPGHVYEEGGIYDVSLNILILILDVIS